jgi:hypothetical protein
MRRALALIVTASLLVLGGVAAAADAMGGTPPGCC